MSNKTIINQKLNEVKEHISGIKAIMSSDILSESLENIIENKDLNFIANLDEHMADLEHEVTVLEEELNS